jgi:hypothetical protein
LVNTPISRGHPTGSDRKSKSNMVTVPTTLPMKKVASEQVRGAVAPKSTSRVDWRDNSVSLEWFWVNRFLPLQTWRVSMRSVVGYVMVNHLLPGFGPLRLCDIHRFDLQAHLRELSENYSRSLVRKVQAWVRAVLDEAVRQRYLQKSQARAALMARYSRPTDKNGGRRR